MSNKRVLVIINARYPYEKSEDFLSHEINYVKGFDEIICFPILIYKSVNFNTDIYKRPEKPVYFFNSKKSYHSSLDKVKLMFLILKKWSTYKELFFLCKSKRFSLKNLKKLFSFLLISNYATNDIYNELINRIKNENVVIYSYWMHCSAFASILLKEKLNEIAFVEKIITRCHRFDLYEYAAEGNYIPMRDEIFSKMDEIHSISEDGLNYLNINYTIKRDKLKLSRLGSIDRGVNFFSKNNTLHLVSCSWLRPVKRVTAIVNAISNLPFRVDWTHYGDGEEFEKIKQLISQVKNPLVTCKLMGAFSNEDVLKEYAQEHYDIFINVSENEGVPVSIMEAMSFGKIIIATNVGGTSEIVEDGVNGFLLNKDFTNDELIEAINKVVMLDSIKFDTMCQQSRKIWEERCDAKKNYEEFYKNL